MAAEDDAAGAADEQPAKQDWGADEDDNALPPLSNMGWADDDEDELPPLDPAWANLPIPDSPKREKPPAAFKPRDDRGAEPRGSVFSRLGDGGGNAWRRPDAPPDRGGPPDRGPPPSRDPPTSREAPARGRRREPENPHDWHREQMRLQEAERAARGERPTPPVNASNSRNHPQSANAMPAEVVYLSRDAQRAAALKREEDAAWRLARVPLATFHATAEGKPAPFAPSSCREMLNALSEPPFAEGRLAPNARAAFVAVASASKCGEKRTDEQVREVVQGVVAPLHHLLTHGVATPGGAAAGSTGAFIAEQMHTAAVKLLAAALEVLGTGEVTKDAVDNAKGIALVREAVKAKLEDKAGAAGGSGGGGGRPGVDKGAGRGDKNDKTPAINRGGHGKDGPAPTPPKGPDRDRWEKRPAPAPRDDDGSGSGSRRRSSVEYSDRRRSLEEKPSPRVSERRADEREPAPRPRVVPKVVIRPSKEDHRQNSAKSSPAPGKSAPQTAKAKNSRSDKKPSGETGDAPSSVSPVPGSGASVFSRLEGTPSPLPAPAEKHHSGSKPPTKSSPAAKPQPTPPPPLKTAVPPPKTASHELPHPKPAVPAPAAKPGKGGGGGGKGAGASSKGDASKKPGASASSGDEWHALDEELEKAAGKVSKGKGKERARESGKERAGGKAGSAEKHEIPHPKTAPPAAHSIPAPKPSPGTAPAPKPAPPKDELDAVLDEELAKAKKSRRSGGRGRGGK